MMYKNAPTKMEVVYCAPEERELDAPPRLWHRARISIPCFDLEQAERISKQIAAICGHCIEAIVGMTDDEGTQNFGEVVFKRTIVPVDAQALAEEREEVAP